MATVGYRMSSGEVMKISLATPNQDFSLWPSAYYGQLTDPPFPDGTQNRNGAEQIRRFGFQKHNDAGTVRNSTQAEIDGYAAFEDADTDKEDRDGAEHHLENNPQMRKVMRGIVKGIYEQLVKVKDGQNPNTPGEIMERIREVHLSKDD